MAGQRSGKQLIQILCVLCVLALSAFTCDNGQKEQLGVTPTHHAPPPTQVATVGADVCTFCHANQTAAWMTSSHANKEAINHTTHAPIDLGLLDDGFPYYNYFSDATCAGCHDPLGDGRNLVQDLTGNAERPVIGCESCHGGGAEHFGVGQIPFPNPDDQRCAQCHSAVFPDSHRTYHPNGDEIDEQYTESMHSESLGEHQLDSTTGDVRARCSRCHTDEGFRKFQALVPGTTGRLDFRAFFTDPVTGAVLQPNLPIAETHSITCRTCHDPHTTSKNQLPTIDAQVIAGVTVSAEFNTCTQCHQLSGADGKVMAGSTVGPYHTDPLEQIADTHAAVPGDTRLNTALVDAVFYVNKKSATACMDCHNPHLANLEPNQQWRQSAHGDVFGAAWTHYDWKDASRQACQRCHTTTGFKNFITAIKTDPTGATYIAANNNFSIYAGNDAPNPMVNGNDQAETLYCWGCHSDYKGGLRNPGAVLAVWMEMDGVTRHQFPDESGSNVCIACHSARESGGSVIAKVGTWSNLSFINSHYLGAALTMFPAGGFQYGDTLGNPLNYANVAYYEHDELGLGLLGSTVDAVAGTNGPCVACHMNANPEKHLFSPVTKDGETVTAINSTLCANCHSGTYALSGNTLTGMKEEYNDALAAMRYVLGTKANYWWGSGNPYIFTTDGGAIAVKNWTLINNKAADGVTLLTGNTLIRNAKKNMGAAFNMNFLFHEYGAFAHNRYYAKRLIYDSIDWIDNGKNDNSVKATLDAIDGTTYLWKDAAIAYICTSTGGRP